MTLHIGIIGTGWFSKVHADLLQQIKDVKIQAILGTSKEKAQTMAVKYGAVSYEDVTTMLEQEHLDAVYVCVPPMAHGEIEFALIERGIPFFVEKPLSVDLDLPMRIEAAVRETGLLTAVGYHLRYQKNAEKLKRELSGQTIGMASGCWNGGMPGVAWWRDQEGSGGQFIEQTTHIVDLLRYVAGEVVEVQAMYAGRSMHKLHEGVTVPDVGTVNLKLQNGAVANIMNTCLLPDGVAGRAGLTLYTSEGIWDWNPEQLAVSLTDGQRTTANDNNPYKSETEAFLHALRTGDRSLIRSDYHDALRTQAVTVAALQSARSGERLFISEPANQT
ncbi:Gfo/Idh/MocA family oxidoreductase [Paenibacillus sp. Marseille-Q4541]|uniref:Gfo/Idh/MocA family protein n=1 Tax=Paenibacillus sp. Marseille-Q4541 TaxID=2831522 RepID=UPI001BA955A6|nr:Gfo/Idh/MocA family oxidoreductase [Paenibacillus sp. Marseille-Q4541]